MSQKTNPISLRLQNSNKHFDSCWYSDFFYGILLGDEYRVRGYVKGILSQAARTKALPSIQSQYKRYCTFLFFLDSRAERHKREFALKLSRVPTVHSLFPKINRTDHQRGTGTGSQNKNKAFIPTWDSFVLNQAQDILYRKSLLQKERYDTLIEKGMVQKRSNFSYNGLKEYVYNYAMKGSSLESLPLRGFDSTKCSSKDRARVESNRALVNNPLVGTQRTAQSENLFRRLIIDRHSQSIQNRLCYPFVRGLHKQLRGSNVSSGVNDKYLKRTLTLLDVESIKHNDLSYDTSSFAAQLWRNKPKELFRYTELTFNLSPGNFGYHTIYPIRALSPYQSADFLIDTIAYLLQRKSSFRQIKDELFRELDQIQIVKGARLSCAGRFGGRSKKAQKAKTQSAQWGETSLTVFSSHLSFASRGVNTTYGKVGVKLWLCYKM